MLFEGHIRLCRHESFLVAMVKSAGTQRESEDLVILPSHFSKASELGVNGARRQSSHVTGTYLGAKTDDKQD
jgi:hypothetical protein